MKILIVLPDWMGDVVFSHSLVQRLQHRYPQASLHLLTPSQWLPVARLMAGTNLIPTDFSKGKLDFAKRWALAKQLKEFDQAYIVPNKAKAALSPFLAGISFRAGWGRRMLLTTHRKALDAQGRLKMPIQAQRFAHIANLHSKDESAIADEPFLWPKLTLDSKQEKAALSMTEKLGLSARLPLVGIGVGAAFGAAKRYPAHHVARLIGKLMDRGVQVVLLGGFESVSLVQSIQAHLPSHAKDNPLLHNLVHRMALDQTLLLLSKVDAFIGNDSGLLHVSAAFQRPVIGLYGPTPTSLAPPLSPHAKVITSQEALACRPCQKRECPLGHHDCMEKLLPEQIYQALIQLSNEVGSKNPLGRALQD